MIVTVTFTDVVRVTDTYFLEELPKHWSYMNTAERRNWVERNEDCTATTNEYIGPVRVLDVEVSQ